MSRLIDADVLEYVKFHGVTDWTPTGETFYQRGWNGAIDAIMRNVPTVDPIKHGHWVEDKERPWRWICSECDTYMSNETDRNMDMNYCPNCGAKMDEVEDE